MRKNKQSEQVYENKNKYKHKFHISFVVDSQKPKHWRIMMNVEPDSKDVSASLHILWSYNALHVSECIVGQRGSWGQVKAVFGGHACVRRRHEERR